MNSNQSVRDIQDFGEQGGVVPVIDVAATSTFMNPADMERTFKGELQGCYLYSRHSNPTVSAFGRKLAAMEGMEAAQGVASGMAAIACAVEQLMPDGGHLVSSRVVYGGTYALFKNVLPRRGIEVSFVDPNDLAAIERAMRPTTKVLYVETLSNPLLALADLKSLADIAHKFGAKLVVDNTFVPMIVRPVNFGADVVVYSCTKYISGGSDLIAGAVCSTREFVDSLVDINHGSVMLTGPVMDARTAHELYLRLDHLGIRMAAHSSAADRLARKMSEAGLPVIYPGLAAHPQHALMKKLMSPGLGFGGMLTLDCGTRERAMKLAQRLQDEKFGLYAVSLGFARTLMSVPSVTTSSEIPEDEQRSMGLKDSLLRLSIGFTGDDEVMAERFFNCWKAV